MNLRRESGGRLVAIERLLQCGACGSASFFFSVILGALSQSGSELCSNLSVGITLGLAALAAYRVWGVPRAAIAGALVTIVLSVAGWLCGIYTI